MYFDGGARTYERFCAAWEAQPDGAGLIDIHSPAVLGNEEAEKKEQGKRGKEVKKPPKQTKNKGAKRTILDELEERENKIRELEEREREKREELEAARRALEPQDEEDDAVYVDVPTIFGDALSVRNGAIFLKDVEIARDDLWELLLAQEQECKVKNREHYRKCEICSSYHVFEVRLLLLSSTSSFASKVLRWSYLPLLISSFCCISSTIK